MENKCKKCNGELKDGFSLLNPYITSDGRLSSQANRGETMTRRGSANLVSCKKCVDCGHSFVEENIN